MRHIVAMCQCITQQVKGIGDRVVRLLNKLDISQKSDTLQKTGTRNPQTGTVNLKQESPLLMASGGIYFSVLSTASPESYID